MLIMLWVKASKSRRMTEKTGDQTINQNCISAYEYQFLIRICISPHSCFFLKFYRLFFGFWWVSASSYLVVVFFSSVLLPFAVLYKSFFRLGCRNKNYTRCIFDVNSVENSDYCNLWLRRVFALRSSLKIRNRINAQNERTAKKQRKT